MKKLKLGKFSGKALTERELKNILGGLSSDSTVTTSSNGETTKTAGSQDADVDNDTDFPELL